MIVKGLKNTLSKINLIARANNVRYINTSAINYKIVKCKLFDIGEGISEVEVIQWNKNEGDKVSEMEELLTVQSDKAAVIITSKYNGVLVKKYAKENDIIKIGSNFCEIDSEEMNEKAEDDEENDNDDNNDQNNRFINEDLDDDKPASSIIEDNSNASNKGKFETEKKNSFFVKASPAVKKKAKEYLIDIDEVGKHFNKKIITLEDLETYYKKKSTNSAVFNNESLEILEKVPLKGLKLIMCKSMNESLKVPLFHYHDTYDIKNLLEVKKLYKNSLTNIEENITLTCLLIKLISIALNDFPILNSKFDANNNTYTVYKNHNICVAIDSPNGLLVPNIKNVQNKSVVDVQKDLIILRDKAYKNKLSKSDISDGTCTISNYGTISGSYTNPIIYDNQACIVGISKVTKKLFLKDGKNEITSINDIKVTDTTNITFGADHRFIDGATLAYFSIKLKKIIENPITILPLLK